MHQKPWKEDQWCPSLTKQTAHSTEAILSWSKSNTAQNVQQASLSKNFHGGELTASKRLQNKRAILMNLCLSRNDSTFQLFLFFKQLGGIAFACKMRKMLFLEGVTEKFRKPHCFSCLNTFLLFVGQIKPVTFQSWQTLVPLFSRCSDCRANSLH